MTVRNIVVIKIVIVALLLCFSYNSNSQVDPDWLKSWNEAVELRPEKLRSASIIVSQGEPGIPLVIQGKTCLAYWTIELI